MADGEVAEEVSPGSRDEQAESVDDLDSGADQVADEDVPEGEGSGPEEDENKGVADPDHDFGADIETGADTLLGFLEEKTKFPVSKIADDLGVPEKTVKLWAKALEEAGYVKITYSAIKGMVLEYDAGKSYEELNVGRSELPTDLDEIEIEVEETDLVEEQSGELKDTEHVEKDVKEEADGTEDESVERDVSGSSSGSRSSSGGSGGSQGSGSSRGGEGSGGSPGSEESGETGGTGSTSGDDSGPEDVSDEDVGNESLGESDSGSDDGSDLSKEEGKEKLKKELKKLGGQGDEQEEDGEDEKKEKLHAKKAKIKRKGSEVREAAGGDGEEISNESQVSEDQKGSRTEGGSSKSPASGDQGRIHLSQDLGGHGEKMLDLGRQLTKPEVENDIVYDELNDQMEELKEFAVENSISDEQRQEIEEVMDRLESYVENAESREHSKPGVVDRFRSWLGKVRGKLTEIWRKYKPVEKVE